MKTRLLLVAVLSLTAFSCVKDNVGSGSDKIELTTENNIFEGDLYSLYIASEIASVDEEIAVLDQIVKDGQSNEQIEKDLEAANQKKDVLVKEGNSTLLPDFLFRRIPRPKPPCPNPQNCDFFGFDFITGLTETQLKSVNIYDTEGNRIGGTSDNQRELSNTNGLAIVDDFEIDKDYFGKITIEVTTNNSKRLVDNYKFESEIRQ